MPSVGPLPWIRVLTVRPLPAGWAGRAVLVPAVDGRQAGEDVGRVGKRDRIRLRLHFGDELLVRSGRHYVLTPTAERLLPAGWAGMVMAADLAKVPVTDTAAPPEEEDPHPVRATAASSGMDSRTAKRRMSNLVISGR